MHQELKARSQIPYGGGWFWKDPVSGVEVRGTNFDMVLQFAIKERQANGIPIGLDFERELERDLCASKPDECEYVDPAIPRKKRLSFADVLNGTRVLLNFKLAGSPLVDHQEANRRASICATCPFNVQFDRPCIRCGDLQDIVLKIIGGQGTPYDDNNKSCSLCGCYTAAHVWLPYSILETGLSDDMKKAFASLPFCWKRPDDKHKDN